MKRQKNQHMKKLPVEKVEYKLAEEDRLCPYGHGLLEIMGKEVTREIEVILAKVYVKEHIRYKYSWILESNKYINNIVVNPVNH